MIKACVPEAVLRGLEGTPSKRFAPTAPPPNEIFAKCNWTHEMKN